jgi:predicted Zn-ribbon and HTH transcriptional regulator
MAKYKCGSCGFSFNSIAEPRRCPYCSKENVYIETDDKDLVKDVDNMLK